MNAITSTKALSSKLMSESKQYTVWRSRVRGKILASSLYKGREGGRGMFTQIKEMAEIFFLHTNKCFILI